MTDYFNCAKNALFESSYYQWWFDHEPESQSKHTKAKRVFLIALPFLGLYKPFGQAVSVYRESNRCISHLSEARISLFKKDLYSLASDLAMTALVVGSLAGTFFKFRAGTFALAAVDIALALKKALQNVLKGEYEEAIEGLLQTVSARLYLLIVLKGTLEVSFVTFLLQGIISLYQARVEQKAGRTPECAAKVAMGMIRFYQSHQQLTLIHKRELNYYL